MTRIKTMKKEYIFYVYILSNYERTTFYIGFTNDIIRRIIEHKNGCGSVFTSKYKLSFLVYYEEYKYARDAISREKELKGWLRKKKIDLIKSVNPEMNDLSHELLEMYQIDEEEVKLYLKSIKDSSPFRAQNDKGI